MAKGPLNPQAPRVIENYLGICANYRGLFAIWGMMWGLARIIEGYLGICDLRELSRAISPTSWIFLGNHDDLGLFGDLAWVI